MSRHNKQSADLINRITVMKKKAAEKQQASKSKNRDQNGAAGQNPYEEPFYMRLIRNDNAY